MLLVLVSTEVMYSSYLCWIWLGIRGVHANSSAACECENVVNYIINRKILSLEELAPGREPRTRISLSSGVELEWMRPQSCTGLYSLLEPLHPRRMSLLLASQIPSRWIEVIHGPFVMSILKIKRGGVHMSVSMLQIVCVWGGGGCILISWCKAQVCDIPLHVVLQGTYELPSWWGQYLIFI